MTVIQKILQNLGFSGNLKDNLVPTPDFLNKETKVQNQ